MAKVKEVKNEVMTLDTAKAEKYIAKYNTALTKCNKSAWDLAKVVHSTVNAPDFKEAFGNLEGYAKQLGVNKSNVSRMTSAYERKMLIDKAGTEIEEVKEIEDKNYSVGQIEEMLTVKAEETPSFIVLFNIDGKTPTKTIREYVKQYNSTDLPDEATEEETVEEINDRAEQEQAEVKLTVTTTDGFSFETENREVIDKIKEYIKFYFEGGNNA